MIPLKEIGELLKRTREEKGLTLIDLQARTKIRLRYLQAIEEGELGKIPLGEVYLKGFLKAYAGALGLDGQAILERYHKTLQPVPPPTPPEISPPVPARPGLTISRPVSLSLFFLLLLVLAAGAVSFLNRKAEAPSSPPISEPSPPPASYNPPPPQPAPKPPEIKATENTPSRIVYVVKAEKLLLTASFEDLCWVGVEVDGQTRLEENVPRGKTLTWEGKESIKIRAGKPWVIKVNLNGVDLGPGGEYGPVRDLVFVRAK